VGQPVTDVSSLGKETFLIVNTDGRGVGAGEEFPNFEAADEVALRLAEQGVDECLAVVKLTCTPVQVYRRTVSVETQPVI
jgi:hypothetical protein